MKKIILITLLFSVIYGQQMAPTFFLPTLSGENFFASSLYGEKAKNPKPCVISFSASWCGPCQKEIKALDTISVHFPEIGFYLIDYKEKKDIVQKWVGRIKTKIPILLDHYGVVAKKFNVAKKDENGKMEVNLPSLFVINKKGEIIYSHTGYKDEDAVILQKLLSEL
ncbi:MAG: TlpA disulfide reductase family protein [Candidatus Marinimicrobia bacterium]|jgi:peroxiredoxin|nr:TlpA disulfide reductase family protein [Candidatus Neomarinimicrobiota bacterium]